MIDHRPPCLRIAVWRYSLLARFNFRVSKISRILRVPAGEFREWQRLHHATARADRVTRRGRSRSPARSEQARSNLKELSQSAPSPGGRGSAASSTPMCVKSISTCEILLAKGRLADSASPGQQVLGNCHCSLGKVAFTPAVGQYQWVSPLMPAGIDASCISCKDAVANEVAV